MPGSELPLAESGAYADRDWTATQKAYAERVGGLDRDVGTLVENLEKLESDATHRRGLHQRLCCPPRRAELDIFNSNGGLKTVGGEMYEGRLRVPLIVKWPAEVTPGSETDFAATTWDMMATLTDMAVPFSLPARPTAFRSFPRCSEKPKPRRGMLYWETREGGFGQGVRIGDWKAVRPCGKGKREAVELYNLKEDPRRDEESGQGAPGDRRAIHQGVTALLAPHAGRVGNLPHGNDGPGKRARSSRGFLL